MVDFDNTEIAFENKSNKQLRKARFVFQLISVSWLNKLGTTCLSIALKLGLPVKGIVKATVFNHFCGGESINDCERTIQALGKFNVRTILDYSVEGKQDDKDFDNCLKKAQASLQRAKIDGNVPYCVIKITGLIPFDLLEIVNSKLELSGKNKENFEKGKRRVNEISRASFEAGIPLMIDAEESWIQDAIDDIALEMMQLYNKKKAIIYNTAQLYRHDRLEYLKSILEKAKNENFFLGLKIVRGAYMEKERERAAEKNYPSPIQPDKKSTDQDYDAAIAFCVDHHDRIALCAGTHNEESSRKLAKIMENKGLEPQNKTIFFSQLLGMSDHISYNLSKKGYNVAKYVPYGPVKDVMPYLIRRANENSSIAGQTGRELNLINKEIQRRKLKKS